MTVSQRFLGILLSVCLLLGAAPIAAVSAESSFTYNYAAVGNSGAVITVTAGSAKSVSVDDTALATATLNGNTITVSGVTGAVGVVTLSIDYGGDTPCEIAVPIGYTTFLFDEDTLTVIPGSDDNYSVTGINAANEEYTEGSTLYPLSVSTSAEGWSVYENTDTYKLSVNIKKKGGTYAFSGVGADMSIAVKKEATDPAVLLLSGLELTSSFTAPITVKKTSTTTVTITSLAGHTNTLTDAAFNNADLYGDTAEGGDGTNVEYAESAVIKGKSYANITLNGTGKLILNAQAKNGIKVGEYGYLTIKETALTVNSVDNGLSCDNILQIDSGNIAVTTDTGDGIRTDPDAVDATLGCAGNILINGGDITVQAGGDAIQAAQDITITGGNFDITTGNGYTDTVSADSRKGLKASFNTDDTSDTSTATNTIEITGGNFVFNTADDAIHADSSVVITGGIFRIQTGDDGVHADTSLTLGAEGNGNGAVKITITNCYEGLEAGNVYIYSGTYDVTASDDGINAAGDSTTGFNPGGQPGRPTRPGSGNTGSTGSTSATSYNINIYGGDITINASSDGVDANTNINLTGGTILVWGNQAGGDGEPLDCDGSLTINGATVFAAGSRSMMTTPSNTSQPYITYSNTVASGKTINVKYNSETICNTKAIKTANYVLYSSPDMTSTTGWSIVIDDAALIEDDSDPCAAGHSWDSGSWNPAPTCTEGGSMVYQCTECDESKTEPADPLDHTYENGYCIRCNEEDPDAVWYTVTFAGEHCHVTTYLTQDTADAYETDAATAFARNSDTGLKDITGDGQVNFAVTADAGYEIVSVEVTIGTDNFKNLKTIDEATGLYRITKITGDLTLTVTTQAVETTTILYGDTDLNGKVEANDALLALQAATSKVALTAEQNKVGDVDTVSGVSAADALLILQHATQKVTYFPVEQI